MSERNAIEASSRIPFEMINQSGLPDSQVISSDHLPEVAAALSKWVDNARAVRGRTSMFDRGAYTPPDNVFDEMRAAKIALEHDDIVSGVAEITEAFAFQGLKWEGANEDDADIFNQVARDLNFDRYVRQVWREEYAVGQSVTALIWGWKEFTVRGLTVPEDLPLDVKPDPMTGQVTHTEPLDPVTHRPAKKPKGQKRKKKYRIYCPVGIKVLDSSKVIPVGFGPLGSDMLAWCSTAGELTYYGQARRGEAIDPLMVQFFTGQYIPDRIESGELGKLGVDVENLLLMNPEMVFRHTMTKSDYQRFANVRLKPIFGLLDLKRQLVQSDRVTLIGAANYILLIRKGEKDAPAKQEELQSLQANYNFIAKLPVIISDHRLSIDIIAPKTDFTLTAERYDVLDSRILSHLLGTLQLGGKGQRNETNITVSHAVARSMENRRKMLARTLEAQFAKVIVEHPMNQSIRDRGDFQDYPSLVYTPRNIALSIDQAEIQALLSLRTQREVSRETILEFFGLDQATEAQRLETEADFFDEIFKSTVPYSSPALQPNQGDAPIPPAVSGPQGGRPVGGGQPKQNAAKVGPKAAPGPSTTPAKKGT